MRIMLKLSTLVRIDCVQHFLQMPQYAGTVTAAVAAPVWLPIVSASPRQTTHVMHYLVQPVL